MAFPGDPYRTLGLPPGAPLTPCREAPPRLRGRLFRQINGNAGGAAVVSLAMDRKAHDTPAEVDAERGDVIVVGPGGIAYSFTPVEAVVTSDRMLFGAAKARGQQIREEERAKPRG